MGSEPFAQRVQNLRDAWSERREMRRIAGANDFDSQFRLLITLHRWAAEAVREIQRVYGDDLSISVSPTPTRDEHGTAFSVFLASTFSASFALVDRPRLGRSRWSVSVTAGSTGGDGGSALASGPERRNGHWTRGRLEELLLSLLGAWERAQSEGEPASARERLRARGA